MKKAGEKAKHFSTHVVFVIVIVLSLYYLVTTEPSITGHQVLDPSNAKAKLSTALESSAVFGVVQAGSICVVINDPSQPLSLQAVKDSTGWTVSEMPSMCSGSSYEDVIVQFPDYDSFSSIVDSPSPRNIAEGAETGVFQIIPSRHVELGGNVVCDETFRQKYCTALKTMTTAEKLIEGDLSCCIEEMTRAQKKLLEEHLQQGQYSDEQKVLEQPTTVAGLSVMTLIAIIGAIILLGGIGAVILLKEGKPSKPAAAKPEGKPETALPGKAGAPAQTVMAPPMAGTEAFSQAAPAAERPEVTELRNYVRQAFIRGYQWQEIRTHLLQIGWDDKTADKVIREAYSNLRQRR
jgi:hypothetical protein